MFQLFHYIFNCFRRFSDATKKAHPLSEDVLINILTNLYSEPIEKLLSTFSRDFFKGLFPVFSTFSRDFFQFSQLFQGTFPFPFRTLHFYSLRTTLVQSRICWSSGSRWWPLPPQYRKSLWKHRYKSESSAL